MFLNYACVSHSCTSISLQSTAIVMDAAMDTDLVNLA